MVDLLLFAHGGDAEKMADKIRAFIQSTGKDVKFFCDQTEGAIKAHGYIDIDVPAQSLECLNHAPKQFETIDCYKSVLESGNDVIVVGITTAAFINNYISLQYTKSPHVGPGEAIACNDYFLPFWAGEHTHI